MTVAGTVRVVTASCLDGVTLRPQTDADAPCLLAIYASTRAHEMAIVDWTEEQKRAFLRMQCDAQHRHYRATCPDASFCIIERDGEPLGRLYLHERDAELRILDITLLPAARGQGIGTALLRTVIADAGATRRRVTIHVEQDNPARRLYTRLGFRDVESRGFYVFMATAPDGVARQPLGGPNASS